MPSTTLYRFFNEADDLLYVGISERGAMRWKEHRKGKDWWQEVATTKVEHFATRAEAASAEERAIRSERPRYNIAHAGTPIRRSSNRLEDLYLKYAQLDNRLYSLWELTYGIRTLSHCSSKEHFCAIAWWYGGEAHAACGVKHLIQDVVGRKRTNPWGVRDADVLYSSSAYDVVTAYLFDSLPDCLHDRDCWTMPYQMMGLLLACNSICAWPLAMSGEFPHRSSTYEWDTPVGTNSIMGVADIRGAVMGGAFFPTWAGSGLGAPPPGFRIRRGWWDQANGHIPAQPVKDAWFPGYLRGV